MVGHNRPERNHDVPRDLWEQEKQTMLHWHASNWPGGTPSKLDASTNYRKGSLITSQGNPVHLLGRSGRMVGGDFEVRSRKYTHSSPMSGAHWSEYRNDPFRPGKGHVDNVQPRARFSQVTQTLSAWESPALNSRANRIAMGATAIARVKPTNPYVDMLSALGELRRDGLPMVIGAQAFRDRALTAKNAGSEYLNYEFGWKPLVNDIRKFAFAVTNYRKILEQYERDSGKLIKRRYDFPKVVLTEEVGVSVGTQPLGTGHLNNFIIHKGPTLKDTIRTRETWFEGAFKYYLPPLSAGASGYEARAAKLLGLRLTPKVLWDLAPWSWAADWFTNTGDVIDNISALTQDGLVMHWGYLMQKATVIVRYTKTAEVICTSTEHTWTQEFESSTKSRIVASPYGFGLTFDGFSNRQKAIMAALGMSRK